MAARDRPRAGTTPSPTRRRPAAPWSWLARQRLSTRLIAGLVLLLAAACAGVAATTYVVLKDSLMASLNSQLQAATERYLTCVQGGNAAPDGAPDTGTSGAAATPPCTMITGQAAGTFNAEMVNGAFAHWDIIEGPCPLSAADRATLRALPVTPAPAGGAAPSTDEPTLPGGGSTARDSRAAFDGPHLTAGHRGPPGKPSTLPTYIRDLPSIGGQFALTAVRDSGGQVLFTGLPLRNVDDTLGRVELGEIAVFTAVVLLAGILGSGMVRLSLRPLRRVAATAALVSELPLETGEVVLPPRVPDSDPRTEVGRVGAAFNRMLGRVESALARRAASENRLRRFAADASHELRTPLAAIRGYTELALRHAGPVPAEVRHALRRVAAESTRMSVLVDELLLLARLDAGRPLAAEPVDVSRLVIDATSDARAARPGHRWLLRLPDEPVVVRGDELRLRQVLTNLLDNAGTHTPPGTTVTVELRASDPVEVSVIDDGPGIPDHLLPNLFERFVRGDTARSPTAGGTGLGLAIVDAVIAAHHGTVAVTSTPGRTCFTLRLPHRIDQHDTGQTNAGTPPLSER